MKILITSSRNVVNIDQIVDWLEVNFNKEGISELALLWVKNQVKKWLLKEGEVRPFNATKPIKGLPDWLRQSIADGKSMDEVVLTDALATRIEPVVDYIEDRLAQDSTFDPSRIGFAAAEVKSAEWHKRLADKAKQAKPELLVEPGAKIIKEYDDGYTWRELTTEENLNREGDLMGHCVGTHGYIRTVVRGGGFILSLRDAKNEPHVTIHLKSLRKEVSQIKGKSNGAVLPKYLDYVFDLLTTSDFDVLRNLDGASELAPRLRDWYRNNTAPVFEYKGSALYKNPGLSYSDALYLEIKHGKEFEGNAIFRKDANVLEFGVGVDYEKAIPLLVSYATQIKARIVGTLPYHAVQDSEILADTELHVLRTDWAKRIMPLGSLTWTSESKVLAERRNSTFCIGVVASDNKTLEILTFDRVFSPIASDSFRIADVKRYMPLLAVSLINKLGVAVCRSMDVVGDDFGAASTYLLPKGGSSVLSKLWVDAVNTEALKISLQPADGESEVKPVDLLNSLAALLKQPEAADVKRAYLALKNDKFIDDGDFKRHGFSLGGRAVNMIIPVLMCTLPVKNNRPFRKWVYTKPNAIKCLTEVLHTPDFIARTLTAIGLSEAQSKTVIEVLRNEYLRLVPTLEELDSYELELDAYNQVAALRKWCSAMKQNVGRSKSIWGTL